MTNLEPRIADLTPLRRAAWVGFCWMVVAPSLYASEAPLGFAEPPNELTVEYDEEALRHFREDA